MSALRVLKGTGVFPDVASGRAIVLNRRVHHIVPFYCVLDSELDSEKQRFLRAVEETREQIQELKESLQDHLPPAQNAIFDAHLLALEDSLLVDATLNWIHEQRHNAEYAFDKVVKGILERFSELDDSYFRERGDDLRDIAQRVAENLSRSREESTDDTDMMNQVSQPSVIVAHVIHPSDIKLLSHPHIIGMATDVGGRTTHTAIIAKALQLPTVVGLHDVTERVEDGDYLIVDGITGTILINPDQAEQEHYRKRHAEKQVVAGQMLEESARPTVTTDGVPVQVLANIELHEEVTTLSRFHADGVGLYRSEFIFLHVAPNLPSEEQHFTFYKEMVEATKGPVIIRTLDLGGEKFFHEVLEKSSEQNPVLGLRAVRFCMKRKDIFRTQLRAILRVSALSPQVRLMFPLISGVDELKQVLGFLEDTKDELKRDGIAYNEDIPVGIMIEVPSAAVISHKLASYVDFFSIGTNDLIQYFIAIDRNNEEVNHLYQPLHPAILQVLCDVFQAGEKTGTSVSLCGEMAGNIHYTTLLLGLGLREFSMTPSLIPVVKHVLRSVPIEECRKLAKQALSLDSAKAIETLVSEANHSLIPSFSKLEAISL